MSAFVCGLDVHKGSTYATNLDVAHAKTLAEEDELIKAGFEFVRYDEKEGVAIYRKRK
jgi:hypothetical protein